MKNLKNFNSWEKAWLKTVKHKDQTLYLIIQHNSCYGDLITRFQIGEDPQNTGVECRHLKINCQLAEQDSLIGVRKFENDSITWEFLWKPLGLPKPEEKPAAYTRLHEFLNELEKL